MRETLQQGREPGDRPKTHPRDSLEGGRRRGGFVELRFVFLAYPSIILARFLAKAALAWFLSTAAFGEVAFVGLLVFGVTHVAVFGLDAALIFAPELDRPLYQRFQRLQGLLGLCFSLGMAAGALLQGPLPGFPNFSRFMLASAPLVYLGSLSTLPIALLLRERRYRASFLSDVSGVVVGSLLMIASAMLGAGAWCMVLGWYANLVWRWAMAHHLCRSIPLGEGGPEMPRGHLIAYARHCMESSVVGFLAGHADRLIVGGVLGRGALGIFEMGLHVSLVAARYAENVGERCLFPVLSQMRQPRAQDLYHDSLTLGVGLLLPLHIWGALAGPTLLRLGFPPSWSLVADIFPWLCLVGGLRTFDILSTTALKARGQARSVALLELIKLGLLVGAVLVGARAGLHAASLGVLWAASLGSLLTLAMARFRLPFGRAAPLGRPLAALGAWLLLIWLSQLLLNGQQGLPHPLVLGLKLLTPVLLYLLLWPLWRLSKISTMRAALGESGSPLLEADLKV